jgi:hypothetical protein
LSLLIKSRPMAAGMLVVTVGAIGNAVLSDEFCVAHSQSAQCDAAIVPGPKYPGRGSQPPTPIRLTTPVIVSSTTTGTNT